MHLWIAFSRDSVKQPKPFKLPLLQSISWWRVPGSNRWPPACKAGALPAELTPHIVETKSTFSVLKSSLSKLHCVFVSPPQIKPVSLGFDLAPWEFGKWWAKTDSLFCGKATPVATVHRTVAKSRLSSPTKNWDQNANKNTTRVGGVFIGSPCWTRTNDLRINSPSLYRLS